MQQPQPMYLSQFGATPPRRRRWPVIVAITAAGLLLVAGATAVTYVATRPPAATPVAAPAVTSAAPEATTAGPLTTTAAAPSDPGQQACDTIKPLVGTGSIGDGKRMREIGLLAAKSSNSSIAISGKLLSDTADIAIAAHGQSDEAKRVAKLKERAADFDKACSGAGYR